MRLIPERVIALVKLGLRDREHEVVIQDTQILRTSPM